MDETEDRTDEQTDAPPADSGASDSEHEDGAPTPEEFEDDPSRAPDDEVLKDIKGG